MRLQARPGVTIDDAVELIERVTYKHNVLVGFDHGPDPALTIKLPNVDDPTGRIIQSPHDTLTITHRKTVGRYLNDRDGWTPDEPLPEIIWPSHAEFYAWVRVCIGEVELHERDEWFKIDGDPRYWPHRPGDRDAHPHPEGAVR